MSTPFCSQEFVGSVSCDLSPGHITSLQPRSPCSFRCRATNSIWINALCCARNTPIIAEVVRRWRRRGLHLELSKWQFPNRLDRVLTDIRPFTNHSSPPISTRCACPHQRHLLPSPKPLVSQRRQPTTALARAYHSLLSRTSSSQATLQPPCRSKLQCHSW